MTTCPTHQIPLVLTTSPWTTSADLCCLKCMEAIARKNAAHKRMLLAQRRAA